MKSCVWALVVVVLVLVLGAVGTLVFQFLWNAIVPALFNGPVLTFWQALGLSTLITIIGSAFK